MPHSREHHSEMVRGYDPSTYVPDFSNSVTVVLEPVQKVKPIVKTPDDIYPVTIIPPLIEQPTAILVGHELGGGHMEPWTTGPTAIMNLPIILGSLLFYNGNKLSVSMALGGSGASIIGQVKTTYHNKNCHVRVHTGLGRAGDAGVQARGARPGGLQTPYGRPELPAGRGAPSQPAQGEDPGDWLDQQMRGSVREAPPGMGAMERFGETFKEAFEFWNPFGSEFGSWIW